VCRGTQYENHCNIQSTALRVKTHPLSGKIKICCFLAKKTNRNSWTTPSAHDVNFSKSKILTINCCILTIYLVISYSHMNDVFWRKTKQFNSHNFKWDSNLRKKISECRLIYTQPLNYLYAGRKKVLKQTIRLKRKKMKIK
jgi:hypothetical protein